ncbi:MAG: septation protein IspZ [Rhodoferax sp.]|nr:septation protein IspZ [Pseudorhodobacter sp.]
MAEKSVNLVLKQVLELGPTIVFFLIYLRIKERHFTILGTDYSGFIVATLIFVPILLASMAVLWWLTGTLSRMQLFTAFMVIFFGGLTAYFNDERFFKMKTTIVYSCMAAILGIGLLQGRSYLEWVIGSFLPMEREGWMKLTGRLACMFVALAVANEAIWRTQSTELWVKLETFGMPAALFAFLWLQIMALQRFVIDPDKPDDAA